MPANNGLPYLFEDAVEMFADMVTRICALHLGNAADAQDCFQNTFIKLYEKFPDFKNCEHMKAWLIRVAINECHSVKRFYLRRNTAPIDEIAGLCVSPPDEGGTLEAVMQLKPDQRDCVYLHYFEGYSVQEIAFLLGANENTVKTRLSRAREKLRLMLSEGGTKQ